MGERSEHGRSLKLPFREVSDKSHSFQRAALKHPVRHLTSAGLKNYISSPYRLGPVREKPRLLSGIPKFS